MNAIIQPLNVGFQSGGNGYYRQVRLDIDVNTITLEAWFVVRGARKVNCTVLIRSKDRNFAQSFYENACKM